jgi:signal transduction histidine kinase
MQARISRSKMESQEVAGRVTDSANYREERLLVKSTCKSSRSSHPDESAFVHQSSTQPPQPLSEVLLWRKITQVVVANAQPKKALSEIAAILGETFGAEGCVISICSANQQHHQVEDWFSAHSLATHRSEILAAHPALEAATLDKGALMIPNLQTSEIASEWRSLPIGAVLSVATRFQGQVNGVIILMRSVGTLRSESPPHPWTESEGATLTTVSEQVAVAISQVSLQQQVFKQAQYQSLIRQLTMSIQNSVDLPKILKLAIDGTAEALQVSRGAILRLRFWDPRHSVRSVDRIPKARVIVECEWRQNQAQFAAIQGQLPVDSGSEGAPLSQSFWVSECVLCQYAINHSSEPIALIDRTDFPAKTETIGIAPLFEPEEMPALLLVPLESKNKLLGFIALQHHQPRVWQADEIELAELVAAQVSSAIMQTETLRQVELLVEERTSQLQQSLELQAKLYEITRKQIEKLREMNQRMDEFLSTLSHELRTPLTSMMLAIRMLREANLTPDRRVQYLNILEQQCTQETNLINDLLALQELETKQVSIQLQKVDLRRVVTELSQSFEQRWALKGLNLDIKFPKRSPALNTDTASLHRILLELLTNAGKYSDPNTTVSVQVAQKAGQQIEVSVSNYGSGISEEELPHIFEKFRRCQGMTQNAVPGTGLGLALVKSLVQHLNGTIVVSSHPVGSSQFHETCFTVTLPQNLDISQ